MLGLNSHIRNIQVQENMMTNKKIKFIKALISYLTFIGLVTLFILITKISQIVGTFNIFFISVLLINLFVVVVNLFFLLKKESENGHKLILLVNAIYSLISGLEFRGRGVIISNNLGPDISVYFKKNWGGLDYGFHYDVFNVVIKLFFYDNTKYPQLSFQVNLIMLMISVFLFFNCKTVKKSLYTER